MKKTKKKKRKKVKIYFAIVHEGQIIQTSSKIYT